MIFITNTDSVRYVSKSTKNMRPIAPDRYIPGAAKFAFTAFH
jgi:hypothetical protein